MKCPHCGKELPKRKKSEAPLFAGEVVVRLPVVGNGGGLEYEVRQSLVSELQEAYPAVDVPATLREIRAWCVTNKAKRKTPDGIPKFLNTWMAKEQNGRR